MANNCENNLKAGRITGNPLCGLCDRICIQVERVFDGCINRIPNASFQLILQNVNPALIYPFTYISTMSNGEPTLTNLVITPVTAISARIQVDVVLPVVVTFSDATGAIGTATSSVTVHEDVILRTPVRSLIPYSIQATASLASEIGNFVDRNTVNIICCLVIILKTVTMSDILVPSYGFAVYPECREGEPDICNLLLNLPLFPPLE